MTTIYQLLGTLGKLRENSIYTPEKLQENPDRLEGYLDMYEALSSKPAVKNLISNLIQKKEPQQQTYSDLEGMR